MEYHEIVNRIKQTAGNQKETRIDAHSVKVCCPVHHDINPSLQVSDRNGKTLIKCHAGCNTRDILSAVGLTFNDLEPEQMTVTDRDPDMWSRMLYPFRNQYGDGVHISAVYDFTDESGKYLYSKLRFEGGGIKGKEIRYYTIDRQAGTYKKGKPREIATLYNLPQLIKAVKDGETVYYVEGEKDVESLRKIGLTATTAGGVKDWRRKYAEYFQGADCVVLPDNDSQGLELAERVKKDLTGIADRIRVVKTSTAPKGDISDYLSDGHSAEDLERLINEVDTDHVKEMLTYRRQKSGETKILQTVRNHEIVLENDTRFSGKIRFDEFSRQAFLSGCVNWEGMEYQARPWNVTDDSATFGILQADYGLTSRNDFADALRNVAYRNKFHPVREVLEALPYKGTGYIRKLLPKYLGAEDTEYNFAVMKLFMLGAVTRVFEPGCKFDFMPILHGGQGIGKSTLLRKLAMSDTWFSDSLDSLDGDKAAQSLAGVWILELGELKSFNRSSGTGAVKRFISATQDRYRVPYERRAENFPRQCVFAGSVNQANFLQDETGNRRFLIVHCGIREATGNIFSEEVSEDIKAAWAEALHIYNTEHPQLILPREFAEQASELQSDAMEDDGTEGMILTWIKRYRGDKVCAIQIWQEALGEDRRPQKWQATNINNILSKLPDWERVATPMKFDIYGSQRGFRRKLSSTLSKPIFTDCETNCDVEEMTFN